MKRKCLQFQVLYVSAVCCLSVDVLVAPPEVKNTLYSVTNIPMVLSKFVTSPRKLELYVLADLIRFDHCQFVSV
jgi:hypothetical protein